MRLGRVSGADVVGADDLVIRIDTQEGYATNIRHTRVVEHVDDILSDKEAMGGAIGICIRSHHITPAINTSCHDTNRTWDARGRNLDEFVLIQIELVAMVVAITICIEADRHP